MRKIVAIMQTTLDSRIATDRGVFWEPFPYGDPEVAYTNQFFRSADTWAMSRVLYDAIVPWWETVAGGDLPGDAAEITPPFAEFAQLQRGMTKVVFSRTMAPADGRLVLSGDLAARLAELKDRDGGDIIVSGGPATLGPILSAPGLVDELLLAIHPKVITAGPRLFEDLTRDLTLELIHAEVFGGGCIVTRHKVVS